MSGLFFMPLPSVPKVSLAPPRLIEGAVALAKSREMRFLTDAPRVLGAETTRGDLGIRVLVHETIGEHEVTVVEVKSRAHFMQWVVQYRSDHKIKTQFNYDAVRDTVEAYLADGFRYFLFDRVELSETEQSMHPLVIEFESASIYYPIRVNKLYNGPSDVQLLILSPDRIPSDRFKQVGFFATKSVLLTSMEWEALWTGLGQRANGNLHFQCFRLADPRALFREIYPYANPAYDAQKLRLEMQARRRWDYDLAISTKEGKEFDPAYSQQAWPDM
jgi:hypothetical protein